MLIRRSLAFVGALLVLVALALRIPSPARATGGGPGLICQKIDPKSGICTVWVKAPGGGGGGKTGGSVSCTSGGHSIPCQTSDGTWSAAHGCYAKVLTPQPPLTDPRWGGSAPVDGTSMYACTGPAGGVSYFVGTTALAIVNPADLARQAQAAMNLHAINIGMAPGAPPLYGFVGLPVWMWAAKPGQSTVGPITRTAAAGGVSVTAKASVSEIDWSMADGHSVRCFGAGTAYGPYYGNSMSPDCGYRYSAPSNTVPGGYYHVTATSHWTITWTGGGATGTLNLAFKSAVRVDIRELQVVVTH